MIIGTSNLVINEIGAVFNVRIEGDADANLFYTDATNDRVGIGIIAPTEKLDVVGKIKLSDNLVIGTAGKGIDFAATSGTGTSELLADYEEGTWTPGQGNQTVVGTYSASGTYTKIGRQVTVRGYATSTGTIAGAAGTYFDNLPFASAVDFPGGIGTNDGGSFVRFFGLNASSNSLFIVSGYAAVAGVFFSCTYFV